MNIDWKDSLSALRANLGDPEEYTVKEENQEDTATHISQTTPLTVVTDKKGRNGKIATIIEGFTVDQELVEDIARKLKKLLGVGGSVRKGEILIQGDYKEKVKKFLSGLNYKVRN